MIECKDLAGKVIHRCTLYEDGNYGPEVHLELTDGTTFSACLTTKTSIEAKHIRDDGGEPQVLKDYTAPPFHVDLYLLAYSPFPLIGRALVGAFRCVLQVELVELGLEQLFVGKLRLVLGDQRRG
jgi:hypothetical protein